MYWDEKIEIWRYLFSCKNEYQFLEIWHNWKYLLDASDVYTYIYAHTDEN